jgi:heme-degrading monooxygenase HmoA
MATMLIQHQVKDFATWRKVFDSSNGLRTSHGEIANRIYRDANNPNRVTVVNTWDTLANAQKFAHSPELKAAMEKAGVEGPPNISFLNEA